MLVPWCSIQKTAALFRLFWLERLDSLHWDWSKWSLWEEECSLLTPQIFVALSSELGDSLLLVRRRLQRLKRSLGLWPTLNQRIDEVFFLPWKERCWWELKAAVAPSPFMAAKTGYPLGFSCSEVISWIKVAQTGSILSDSLLFTGGLYTSWAARDENQNDASCVLTSEGRSWLCASWSSSAVAGCLRLRVRETAEGMWPDPICNTLAKGTAQVTRWWTWSRQISDLHMQIYFLPFRLETTNISHSKCPIASSQPLGS